MKSNAWADSPTTAFTFDQRSLNVMDELKAQIGASSRGEVLEQALALLKLMVEGANGNPVEVQTKDGPIRLALK